jgi:hypothetical protein
VAQAQEEAAMTEPRADEAGRESEKRWGYARELLVLALRDFRDAGADAIDVVAALDGYLYEYGVRSPRACVAPPAATAPSAPPRDEAAALLREARVFVKRLRRGEDEDGAPKLLERIDAYLRRAEQYGAERLTLYIVSPPSDGDTFEMGGRKFVIREQGFGVDLSNIRLSELPPFGKVYRYSEKDDAWLPTEPASPSAPREGGA